MSGQVYEATPIEGGAEPPRKGPGIVRRLVMTALPIVYATLFVVALYAIWASMGFNVTGDIVTLCLVPLGLFLVLSLPSLIGMTGRLGPFALSWGVTVALSILLLVMMAKSDDALTLCCVSFIFLPLVLIVVVIATLVSGAWAALAAVFRSGGPKWTAALLAGWLLLCAIALVAFVAALLKDVGPVRDAGWLLGCCWLLLATAGTAALSGLHLLLSRRRR